jgi:hypothetical protein
MSRRQPASISLFPFLSVLMCAIGTLVLVICGMTLLSLESEQQTFVVTIEEQGKTRRGQAFKQQPVYIVCAGAGLTIFRSSSEQETLPAEQLDDARIGKLVSELRKLQGQRWPVLFVKPSGLDHMTRLYTRLTAADIKVGRWAFAEDTNFVCEDGVGR